MTFKDKIRLSQNIAIVAGIFCVVVASLLLLNYWQISKNDPVNSKVLETLVLRLKQEPNNKELIAEIRNYDLLARKAYFTSQWQIKTGAYMLLAGSVVLVIALTVYYTLKSRIDEPDKHTENEIAGRILAQKWIVAIGILVFGLAFLASQWSADYLKVYLPRASVAESPEVDQTEQIEVIEVGELTENTASGLEQENIKANSVTDSIPVTEEIMKDGPVAETEKTAVNAVVPSLTPEQVMRNHNSFRGPFGQGIIYHKNIPSVWNGEAGDNILWKSPIPKHGFNSPVIWDDKIFIAGADNQNREVYCYNRNDGKLLWTANAGNIPGSPSTPPRVTEDTGLSAPTLTVDGKSVYAIFATGDVAAFDMNGTRVWARNLGVPDNHYGHSSSLITWDKKLFIQYDTNKGGKIIALDTATGQTVWETVRKSKISWASPVLVNTNGKYQVILTSDPIVAGYDIQSGSELWSVNCMMGEVGPSVAYSDGIVYAANEYARLVAIDLGSREILWENDMYLPEASSPMAHNGLLFIATSYGVLACYDGKTGEQYWEHDVGKTLYSSPVYADGKVFIMDNDGVMRVYSFGKEFKLIAENKLGESAGTIPAFSDGRIYIRGEDHLYCIGK